jgi:hypothetical protein
LGANLSCRWHKIQDQETLPWQSFNISRTQSINLLQQYQQDWDQYPVTQDENGYQYVVEVNAETYYCSNADLFMD